MKTQNHIRNFSIIAHIDHGKTTLSDNLIAGAGMMSEDLAGKSRVLDFDEQEAARGITINGKKILSHKFSLKSKDPNLSDDKKLDFEIWLEPKKNIILKVSYNRLGNWEYILKDIILD